MIKGEVPCSEISDHCKVQVGRIDWHPSRCTQCLPRIRQSTVYVVVEVLPHISEISFVKPVYAECAVWPLMALCDISIPCYWPAGVHVHWMHRFGEPAWNLPVLEVLEARRRARGKMMQKCRYLFIDWHVHWWNAMSSIISQFTVLQTAHNAFHDIEKRLRVKRLTTHFW